MDRKVAVFQFDDVRVDAGNAQILKCGQPVAVEPKALRVLVYLLENRGRLVEKDELLKAIWQGAFVTENALTREIALLRKALGDRATEAKYIETVPTRGYRFIAPVAGDAPGNAPIPGPLAGTVNTSSEDTAASQRPKRVLVMIAAALAVMAAVGLGLHRWVSRRGTLNLQNMEITKLTDSGKAARVAISPDGRYVVYSLSDADEQSLRLRQVATRSDVQILPPDAVNFPGLTFSPDGNYIYFVRSDKNAPGFNYLYRMPVLGGAAQKLIRNIDSAASFSPDGHQLAFTRGFSSRGVLELRIANPDGTGERSLASLSKVNVVFQDGAAWSPDGRTIALSVRNQYERWALDTVSVADGSVRELYSRQLGGIGRPVWLPDGRTLLAPVGIPIQNHVQLWAFSYPRGEVRRFTNDLTDYDFFIDLTRDGNTLATIESTVASNIWVAPSGDSSVARQLTFGGPPLVEAIDEEGQIVAVSQGGELWKMKPDGSQRTLFAEVNNVYWITRCGRFVVFNSAQPGGVQLVRAEADGSNITKLTTTNTWLPPSCSPNGKFMFYVTLGPPKTIWRMPIEGGSVTEVGSTLGEGNVSRISISPDSKLLAYAYEEHSPEPVTRLAVVSVEGGPPVRLLPAPGGGFGLNWSPDGKGLQYLITRDGVTNLWEQPLAGGEAKQVTKFSSGLICDFNWSSNHKQLLLARGEASSDVILFSNFH
jgi:Tol biopolymer transport system component/DNA-binding winged helix-turn-helix (wHTH) protein